jgi:2-hydroxychromene-2-carboxylate isomerase
MRIVELWFEFASPYSYLAVARIAELAQELPIVWRPFLLGPIFGDRGWTSSPFTLFPDKGRHMWRDVEREAAHYGIPFRKPTMFPAKSVLATRVALIAADDGFIEPFARAVFTAHFVRDEDIADPAVIDAVLATLGRDGSSLRERALTTDNKDRLRANVDRARELGIFGAPMFHVGDELFWGNDRLERALAHARRA